MFGDQARRVERCMNILTDAVKVTLGPEGAKRRAGRGKGRANHHQ
jgi:hypothetical protein